MPRFHIHVHNSIGTTRDEEGQELRGLEEAEQRAVEGVRSILSEELLRGSFDLRGHVDIATPEGEILRTIRFREMVRCHLGEEEE